MVERHLIPDQKPWEPLKRAFLTQIDSITPSSPFDQAAEIWRIFTEDAWFQRQLEARARRELSVRNAPFDWIGDVRQEVLLQFANQLRKSPDLRVDRELVDKTFPSWIGIRISHACNDVVDRLKRLSRLEVIAVEGVADRRCCDLDDLRIDISMALEAQPEPVRTILLLSAKGYAIKEIAKKLHLTY